MAGVELTLGEKIAVLRSRLKETQEAFGGRFHVKPLTVNQWEKGRSAPAQEHADLIKGLFRDHLQEEDEGELEIQKYEGPLPFGQAVQVNFRISPQSEKRCRLSVEVKRKVS